MAIDWKKPLEFFSKLDSKWYDCILITDRYCPDDPKLDGRYAAVLVQGWWDGSTVGGEDAVFTYTIDGDYIGDPENYIGTIRNKILPEGYTYAEDGSIEAEYEWPVYEAPAPKYEIEGFGLF